MKNLSLFVMIILSAITLGACGGGAGAGESGAPIVTHAPSDPANSEELILNSGRGTVNNQDTEQSD